MTKIIKAITARYSRVMRDPKVESEATIMAVPDSETGQQSAPHIQLELIPRQPQQGDDAKVLVENNLTHNVCHMAIRVIGVGTITTIM